MYIIAPFLCAPRFLCPGLSSAAVQMRKGKARGLISDECGRGNPVSLYIKRRDAKRFPVRPKNHIYNFFTLFFRKIPFLAFFAVKKTANHFYFYKTYRIKNNLCFTGVFWLKVSKNMNNLFCAQFVDRLTNKIGQKIPFSAITARKY